MCPHHAVALALLPAIALKLWTRVHLNQKQGPEKVTRQSRYCINWLLSPVLGYYLLHSQNTYVVVERLQWNATGHMLQQYLHQYGRTEEHDWQPGSA